MPTLPPLFPLPPGSTLGVLGGGQLGRMLSQAASRLGFDVVILDPEPDCPAARVSRAQITAAYELLMRYCTEYRFPLRREGAGTEELDIYDPEDWWQARFGQDPMWSGRKTRRR